MQRDMKTRGILLSAEGATNPSFEWQPDSQVLRMRLHDKVSPHSSLDAYGIKSLREFIDESSCVYVSSMTLLIVATWLNSLRE